MSLRHQRRYTQSRKWWRKKWEEKKREIVLHSIVKLLRSLEKLCLAKVVRKKFALFYCLFPYWMSVPLPFSVHLVTTVAQEGGVRGTMATSAETLPPSKMAWSYQDILALTLTNHQSSCLNPTSSYLNNPTNQGNEYWPIRRTVGQVIPSPFKEYRKLVSVSAW